MSTNWKAFGNPFLALTDVFPSPLFKCLSITCTTISNTVLEHQQFQRAGGYACFNWRRSLKESNAHAHLLLENCSSGCTQSHTEHTNYPTSNLHTVSNGHRTMYTFLNIQTSTWHHLKSCPQLFSQSSNWADRPTSLPTSVLYSGARLPALVRCLWQVKTAPQLGAAACLTPPMLRKHCPFTRAVVLEGTETNTELQC